MQYKIKSLFYTNLEKTYNYAYYIIIHIPIFRTERLHFIIHI